MNEKELRDKLLQLMVESGLRQDKIAMAFNQAFDTYRARQQLVEAASRVVKEHDPFRSRYNAMD